MTRQAGGPIGSLPGLVADRFRGYFSLCCSSRVEDTKVLWYRDRGVGQISKTLDWRPLPLIHAQFPDK